MGRTVTTKYQVTLYAPGMSGMPYCWNVKRDGMPTGDNLRKHVEGFEASTREGGVNAHLGEVRVPRAAIRLNDGSRQLVAEYEAPRAPLFMLVTTDHHNV